MRVFGRVTLDYDSFRALASPIRVDILKHLDARRMTLSDLARALAISKSTIHRYMEQLCGAGLVHKEDDERKWVYYRITDKGLRVLHPQDIQVSLLLSTAVFLIGAVLIASAVYLVWFPPPAVTFDILSINVLAVSVGVACIGAGGLLLARRTEHIEEAD